MTVADLALSLLAIVAIVQLYVVLRDRQAVDPEPSDDLVVPIECDELNTLRIKARAFDSIREVVERRDALGFETPRDLSSVRNAVVEANVALWMAVDPQRKQVQP